MELSTPNSSKPLSDMPGSRVFKSPLTNEQIWKLLRNVGFNEESIKHKDMVALIAYTAKLKAERLVVGQEHCAVAKAKQAVCEDHGSIAVGVPVRVEGLRSDQQQQLVPLRLDDVFHNVHEVIYVECLIVQ